MTTSRWLICLAGATLMCAGAATAQPYPNRPLRLLVPGASGSSQDVLSRILATRLSEQIRQQVVVDDRAGASGMIGIELGKTAAPDGYTLIAATSTLFATLPALGAKLSFDPDRDFVPLTRMASVSNVLLVNAGLGVSNVAELVKLAKARPAQLNYGSAGNGTPAHLGGAMLNALAGITTNHIPYKGAAQALTDVMGGQLQYLITSPLVAMPHASGGRIRVIASTGAQRDPLLPQLPTVAETLPGFEITQWWGIVLPAKTPSSITARLHGEIVKALRTPDVVDLIAKQGATVRPETPAEFVAFMKAERTRIAAIGKQAAITIE